MGRLIDRPKARRENARDPWFLNFPLDGDEFPFEFMHQGEIHIFRVTSFLNLGHSGLKWNRGLFLSREVSVFCVFTVLLVTSRPRARPIRD